LSSTRKPHENPSELSVQDYERHFGHQSLQTWLANNPALDHDVTALLIAATLKSRGLPHNRDAWKIVPQGTNKEAKEE
jgi:hypothetical protein